MPNGPRVLIENACYHIIAKGNHRQAIFRNEQDYRECLNRLIKYKKRYDFLIYGYCLMPNHIHILGEIKPICNISRLMASFLRSYTSYFNNKYNIEGQLWQGRFKSKVILKDVYLLDCINYIEANPIKAGLAKSLQEYKWNSYAERALGENKMNSIVSDLII